MSHFDSPIVRLTTGNIDTINDTVIAGAPAFGNSTSVSMLAGQLGQGFWLDDSALQYASATPVYGGHFRYVLLKTGSTAVVRGQLVFWDTLANAADNAYQVTTAETGSATGATLIAGVVLNAAWGASKYSVIQDAGVCYVQFRASLTGASAAGAGVYAAGAGAGADNGFADTQSQGTTETDIMLQRFLGTANGTPSNGSLTPVYLRFTNLRG